MGIARMYGVTGRPATGIPRVIGPKRPIGSGTVSGIARDTVSGGGGAVALAARSSLLDPHGLRRNAHVDVVRRNVASRHAHRPEHGVLADLHARQHDGMVGQTRAVADDRPAAGDV